MKFSRKIKFSDPIIPYKLKKDYEKDNNIIPEEFISDEAMYTMTNNCHWGQLKLLFSEIEFFTLVSKYVNIDDCLVLYIGAQPGERLKYLYIKYFYPKMHMLLYDPLPFDIEETDQLIIKTGSAGWFSDEKIKEVLKIADGRKIIYMSDIRIPEPDDTYLREKIIYENMQDQERWGILMGADFMLFKFRSFYYKTNPDEVDFIQNSITDKYAEHIVYKKNRKKHDDIHKWWLYLKGTIYTQLYAAVRSTESRLFVKKIKYYKDANKYKKEEQEKYKMRYYDNILYEGLFNYFNLKKRNSEIVYRKSDRLVDYLPGQKISYTSASEYYIIRQYLKSVKQKPSFKNVLKYIVISYTVLSNYFNNDLIRCVKFMELEKMKKNEKHKDRYKIFAEKLKGNIDEYINKTNNQFNNIRRTKLLDNKTKNDFIKSFRQFSGTFFILQNGKLIQR